jgi:hypothetical protein
MGLYRTDRNWRALGAAAIIAISAIGGAGVSRAQVPDYAVLMAAPDRSEADRETDKRRDPVPLLAFAGLRPGMRVLDMGAGAGYSTERHRLWAESCRFLPARAGGVYDAARKAGHEECSRLGPAVRRSSAGGCA